MMKYKYKMMMVMSVVTGMLLGSCGSSDADVELVDLDVVLDKFTSSADAQRAVTDEASKENDAHLKLFVAHYSKALNDAKLTKLPVGVAHQSDGSFLGFQDKNKNGAKDAGEMGLFKVEADTEKNRLIAFDLTHKEYRRDRGYSMGSSIFMGYMIGRMMSGQRRSGLSSNRFRNTRMSNSGYHKKAVKTKTASARKAKSARSSSGSRSFRSGK